MNLIDTNVDVSGRFGFLQRCAPYVRRSDPRAAALTGTDVTRWTVPDLCGAYGWPRNLAGGGVIAIVELDGGWARSDMATFFNSIGQPMPHIAEISIDGTRNNPSQHVGEETDPDVEVALDIQVAAASYYVATGKPAKIRIYWAADTNPGSIAAAIRRATADGCDVCSISWGSDEANWQGWSQQNGIDYIADLESAAEAATRAGMIVLASSGDNDSSDGGDDPANVDAPSSCPHVIGCGGTSKTRSSEAVWNDNPGQTNGEGTGGGYSAVFPPQAFQVGAPYPPPYLQNGSPKGRGRLVPDIAANADPNTGYWMFVHGHKIPMGGTSAVAPLYAGLFAALGKKLGFVTDKLWANKQCFNDITDGENGAYRAMVGPDPCTGLGSPIGARLAELLMTAGKAGIAAIEETTMAQASQGWSGTIVLNIVDGELVGSPKAASGGHAIAARAAATSVVGAFGARAGGIATAEWDKFGNQTYDLTGHATHIGHKEGEEPWYKYVGTYWRDGVNNDTLDGRDHSVPWSAAFISWVMRTAGAGNRFSYSPQHSVYIYRAIRDLLQAKQSAGYWCYRLNEWKPQIGDLVCWSRTSGIDYEHQNGGDYPGHCDIVVSVDASEIQIIGGNVGDSVTKRPLALNASGFVEAVNEGGETLFAIMRCRIDDAA